MILLDTNVISALMREVPDEAVVRWLDSQPGSSIWTTSITVFEIRFGLQTMPEGKRQRGLIQAFDSMLARVLEQRIAVFDGQRRNKPPHRRRCANDQDDRGSSATR